METNSKEIVLSFIKAINEEDFKTAKTLVSDDMKFEGVLASRNGATAYFDDMEKMKMKYDIQKIIAEGDDVSMLSDVTSNGATLFTSSWYQLKSGKINFLKVVFDPRPVLEK
ncbi:nuclear transport factor 2 family protein [Flavobacterium sp.]|uniref:nuclear transport factor 2 family protein n=1 Tax=Flavobacterium sp. TaxID=239 RepID=UPI002B9F1A5A|nr:nuclear transport factor 2 family protein [Flavobacterium sp.]HSD05858.1 nuclear transport factor 2 family protein [Flavobacterium sp.]